MISVRSIEWTAHLATPKLNLRYVSYGPLGFVAVGVLGMVLVSPDGQEWERWTPDRYLDLDAAASTGQLVVTGGAGGLMTFSPGGSVVTTLNSGCCFTSIAAGAAGFVALGVESGFIENQVLLWSEDGTHWEDRSAGFGQDLVLAVTHANDRFVAIGGGLALSTDGREWLRRQAPWSNSMVGLTFGDNRFVGVGENGVVTTSTDGASWAVRKAPTDANLQAITWGDGLYVAVGEDGTVLSSMDSVFWSAAGVAPVDLHGVTYGQGTFVAVGQGGTILLGRR